MDTSRANAQSLQGKTVVITGASRGLGAAIAELAMERGANLGLCARSMPQLSGDSVLGRECDVSNEGAIEALMQECKSRFGQVDMWINNAGVLNPIAPLREVSSSDFAKHIEINLLGVFHGSKVFANHVRERKGTGVLVNISSGATTSAYEGWGAYCAGKAAVDHLSEVLALEEKDTGLRVHAVAPGIIDTDMQALIRSTSASKFPMVEKFHELKRDDAFSSARFVSDKLLELAFNSNSAPTEVCLRLPSEK